LKWDIAQLSVKSRDYRFEDANANSGKIAHIKTKCRSVQIIFRKLYVGFS